MKWLRRIILFVLLGAVVNVLVAWGIVVGHGRMAESDGHVEPFLGERNCTLIIVSAFGYCSATTHKSLDPSDNGVSDPNEAIAVSTPVYPIFNGSRWWNSDNLPNAEVATHVASGWPSTSLCTTLIDSGTAHSASVRMIREGYVSQSALQTWNGEENVPVVLPLRPLWPGFIADTAIYSIALYLLTLAFSDLRRWRRRRNNLCLKCGYALAGNTSGVCPECGKVMATSPC